MQTPAQPLILALETSTEVFSAALFRGSALLGIQEYFIPKIHGRVVTAAAQQLLENCDLTPQQLSAVAVAAGPGSYTGLRISTSAAKGLCMALDIPLIAVPTLQALAVLVQADAQQLGARICPLLDARRMEVYYALYDAALTELQPAEAHIITAESFAQSLAQGPVVFIGDGAAKCAPLLASHPNAIFRGNVLCSARGMGALAYQAWQQQQFADVITFEPFYLKPFAVGPQAPPANAP